MSLSRRNLSFRDDISGPMSEACPLIGATEEEAQRELDALSAPEVGRERLSAGSAVTTSRACHSTNRLRPRIFPILTLSRRPAAVPKVIVGLVRRERPTLHSGREIGNYPSA
jgi:hypothetical protein